MVSFGPWTQDVDYPTFKTFNTNKLTDYTQQIAERGGETPFQDPVYPITVSDMEIAFDLTQLDLNEEGAWVEYFTSGYDLSFPDWKSGWEVKIWARTMHVAGWQNWYNPPNRGTAAPEGAIGIDYQGQPYNPEDPWAFAPAEVQAMELGVETEFEGQFKDDRVAGGFPLPWSVTSTLFIRPPAHIHPTEAGPIAIATMDSLPNDTAPNWAEMNLAAPIDMAPYGALEGAAWTADLFTKTLTPIIGGDPAPYNTTFTSYGWMVNSMRLNATVRPPLYRWVFEGGHDTYRRNFPRDDGLAGGARRNYPPSKSTQYGNRTSGGYL